MAHATNPMPTGAEGEPSVIRAHRRRHLVVWIVLGPLILIGFALGLSARRAQPTESFTPPSVPTAEDAP